MPKVSSLQSSFNAGELSPLLYGRVDAERYKAGLQTCFNYIPTLQGPITRRPGTKFVNGVKDPSKPPVLIPFPISQTLNYLLEVGDKYMRFYTASGQVVTSSNQFQVAGSFGSLNSIPLAPFTATRPDFYARPGELLAAITLPDASSTAGSSLIAAGSVLELVSPYAYADLPKLKWCLAQDTLFLTHPSYPTAKLVHNGATYFDLKPLFFQDGPYLPLNSYLKIGDSIGINLSPANTGSFVVTTGSSFNIIAAGPGPSGILRITTSTNHNYKTGDKVFVAGVPGTVEANNGTSSIQASFWNINVPSATQIDLLGGTFVNTITGSSGIVYPALFQLFTAPSTWNELGYNAGRSIALYNGGVKYWGVIWSVTNPAQATILMGPGQTLPNTNAISIWQMGVYNKTNGYPAAVCIHQNRLCLAGAPGVPQEVDGSYSSQYENFSPNNSSLVVADSNAFQFTLNSTETNALRWLKSHAQGLLAGSASSEWNMSPSNSAGILTPTNFNAVQTSFFGSADVDSVQLGNATVYVSKTGRKIREMNFFFQVGTFRSTDLTELSEHVTLSPIIKIAAQKESQPVLWGVNSSGNLVSMSYNRDDTTIKAGWARHQLGGQSDLAGTNPIVSSIGAIPSQDGTFDQLWMVVKRFINNTSAVNVEYLTKIFDDSMLQEDAIQGDCTSTYDSPIQISGLTVASAAIVTANGHGFSNGDTVKIVGVVGLGIQITDVNNNVSTTNPINENNFQVGSSLTNTFSLLDFNGNGINTNSSALYVSGGQVRKLVTTISGITQLRGETVGVWADGGAHPDVTVTTGGVATLTYPAAKVQFGYRYNSDGATLTTNAGSAQGSAIGSMRRVHRIGLMVHNVADIQIGAFFNTLIPLSFEVADQQQADQPMPLFSGLVQEGIESRYDLTDDVCFRQNSMGPGMIQALTIFMEESDV